MSGPLITDPLVWAPPKTRVWVAGPERIVTFDCQTLKVHAECTRQNVDGTVTRVPRRMVATDAHGRERTVYLEGPQPYEIVTARGTPPEKPSEGWLNAVEVWRLRRKLYPEEPRRIRLAGLVDKQELRRLYGLAVANDRL